MALEGSKLRFSKPLLALSGNQSTHFIRGARLDGLPAISTADGARKLKAALFETPSRPVGQPIHSFHS